MPNASELLSYIKANLGSINRVIPFTDDEIMKVVYEDSLVTYSTYFPYLVYITVNPRRDVDTTPEHGIYRINLEPGLQVFGIVEILRYPLNAAGGPYLLPQYDTNTVFEAQASADLMSMVRVPDTARFFPPNKIEIFPKYYYTYDFTVRCKCIHPKHLQTIGVAMFLEFRKLCLYDVRNYIYEALQTVDGLNTAFGNIDMKLDRFQSALDDRRNLLEEWEKRQFNNANRKKLFIL